MAQVIAANAGVILLLVKIHLYNGRYPRECGGDPKRGGIAHGFD